ncbi:MAG: threonine-phosphate decarboxylase [Methylophilaceae bacterium]|nr:threonine-phosphate decarboxylase [Methylophilaceae bacterium]
MLEHGGNLANAATQYGIPQAAWLDLSTGINPNGYPIPPIPPAFWQHLPSAEDGLVVAASAYYGSRFALPTSGSQAAIQVLPALRAPCRVAILIPMYQEHAHAWRRGGHEVNVFSEKPDTALLEQTDVLILCNPNNPTAARFQSADLLHWHKQLAKRGGWLVVDEAFMDASPEASIAQYSHLDGLFVLRSLGKFFGLAGARVGFLLAAEEALHAMQAQLGPWPLNGAARFIAKQALKDKAWQQQNRIQLVRGSQRLAALLSQYDLAPQAGTALFQWVPTPKASAWHAHLAQQGIWVRLFAEFSALRFGLPPEDGWHRLEAALKSFSD